MLIGLHAADVTNKELLYDILQDVPEEQYQEVIDFIVDNLSVLTEKLHSVYIPGTTARFTYPGKYLVKTLGEEPDPDNKQIVTCTWPENAAYKKYMESLK